MPAWEEARQRPAGSAGQGAGQTLHTVPGDWGRRRSRCAGAGLQVRSLASAKNGLKPSAWPDESKESVRIAVQV